MLKTKTPHELEIGECFSYIGSFKIYRVVTKPEVDHAFDGPLKCDSCGQDYLPFVRLKFEVTDEGTQGQIGIRLRSDVECTIHTIEELVDQAIGSRPSLIHKLEAILARGHFEHWGGTWKFYFAVEEDEESDENKPFEGERIEDAIHRAYAHRMASLDPDQT